jgi:pyridoxal phosphate enzyme (YggS family)
VSESELEVREEVRRAVARVRERIEAACARAGRDPADVTLVGVSKFQPDLQVRAAVDAGVHDLGENYAQAMRDRAEAMPDLPVRWHQIGPLQRNKVNMVVRVASYFHALDSVAIADALGTRRDPSDPLLVLVQVNIAGEETKSGVAPAEVPDLLAAVAKHPSLRIAGLMCMPPAPERPEDSREHFAAVRELGERLGVAGLSIGTTDDFEVAVEEGATMVRVGRVVFGERHGRPAR